MKRTLLTLFLSLVATIGINAQVIKEDARAIAFFEGTNDYDYLYADNSITCFDKRGNVSHEITLNNPSDYKLKSLIENKNDLTMVFHKSYNGIDSIVKLTCPKTDLSPAWKPAYVFCVKSKRIDFVGSFISPDKSKTAVAIGYRTSKKGNMLFETAVINSNGDIINNKAITTYHKNKQISHIDMTVNNDGMVYVSYFSSVKIHKRRSNNYCLYSVDSNVTYHGVEVLPVPWAPKNLTPRIVVAKNGDQLTTYITSSLTFVLLRFDYLNKELSYNTNVLVSPYNLSSSFNNMSAFSSPVKGYNYIVANSIYEMGDGSYISLSEATGESHKETSKVVTYTTKDKNGKTYTHSYTTVDRTDYRTYAGDILVKHFIVNDKSIDFHNSDIIKKNQRASGEYSALRFENKYQLSFATDMHDSKVTVLFREGHWYSKTITIGDDKSINVSDLTDYGVFKFTNTLLLRENYWIVYRKHGKRYDVKLLKSDSEQQDDVVATDDSDESPEYDDDDE